MNEIAVKQAEPMAAPYQRKIGKVIFQVSAFGNPQAKDKPVIIGLDHGYGNMKTAHNCFQTGVTRHDREPTFKTNLLFYDGQYYSIGEEHKEFTADKMTDQDYFTVI